MKKLSVAALVLAGALLLSGCAGKTNNKSETDNSSDAESQQTKPPAATISIVGSVGALPLMTGLSEAYKQTANTEFSINASGKNAAIGSLQNNECDIGIFEGKEADLTVTSKILAYKTVALIINPSVNITGLSSQQITSIFTGESTSWADFGGRGDIALILPPASDSFRQSFEEACSLRGKVDGILKSLIPDTALLSESVEQTVLNTEGAIGIVPAASLKDLNTALVIDGVTLSDETVKDGSYKLAPTLVIGIKNEASLESQSFYDYVSTEAAAEIIIIAGFYPVK